MVGKMLASRKFIAGTIIATTLLLTPTLIASAQDTREQNRFNKAKPGSELIAENSGSSNMTMYKGKIVAFFDHGKRCVETQRIDKTFSIFERDDEVTVAGFYRKDKNGRVTVQDIDFNTALGENSGYKFGDRIGIYTIEEGKTYVLFPKGSSKVLLLTTETAGNDNERLVVTAIPTEANSYVCNGEYKVTEIKGTNGNESKTLAIMDKGVMVISPENGIDRIVSLNPIFEMVSEIDKTIKEFKQIEITPLGSMSGKEMGTPEIDKIYVMEVSRTGNDEKLYYAIWFEQEGDKTVTKYNNLIANK